MTEPASLSGGWSATSPRVYVEVENGQLIVLPRGMSEADLLRFLRQVLADGTDA